MSLPEAIVKAEIKMALEEMGETVLRLQSGKVKVRGAWMNLCPTGTPDLLVLRPVPVWIEVKANGQKTNKDRAEKQAAFAERVKAMGHRHVQATSVEQVMEAMK